MAKRKWTPEELSSLCAQVAMMLSAGMPLYQGMEALAEAQVKDDLHDTSAKRLSELVTETGSLHDAFGEMGEWPTYLTEMTGIGEKTGKLEEVMNGLSVYYKREGSLKRAVANAVAYPIVLGAMLLLIIGVMLVKVLPVFRDVLGGMGASMTDGGSGMVRMGMAAGIVALVVVGILLLAALVCVGLMRTKARDQVVYTLRKIFPPFGKVMDQLSAARAASVLSMMLSGGFPMEEALDLAKGVVEDKGASESLNRLKEDLISGEALEDAIGKTGFFDTLSLSMLRTASAAGCVDEMMGRVASDYEQRATEGVDRLVSVIEPALVAVLCVVIGAILLSVMLPMAGMISNLL